VQGFDPFAVVFEIFSGKSFIARLMKMVVLVLLQQSNLLRLEFNVDAPYVSFLDN
jgi:hypothetical protein